MANFNNKIYKRTVALNVNNKEQKNDFISKKESKSVLKLVSEKNINENEDFMEKGFTKYQNEIYERGLNLITKEQLDKPFLSACSYRTLSLLTYCRDKNLFDKINNFTDEEYLEFLKDKNSEIINSKSFNDSGDFKRFPLIVIAGGKQNHKYLQQDILEKILQVSKCVCSYYEPFAGGLGSVYNSLPILLENGIEDIYISDINPSIINTYRQVQRNHKSVQRELAKIELDFFREYGKLHASNKEELKAFFQKKLKELNELEKKKRMNAKRAALFLYLMNICQGGMNNYDMETKTNKFNSSFDGIKHKKIAFIINKVEIYHQIFKLAKFQFRVKRYQTVLKNIKNDNTAFVLLDPEYVEYGEEVIKSCKHTYTSEGKGFNHLEVLRLLNRGKNPFIYYNNQHKVIEEFSLKNGFKYHKEDVEYTNGNKPKPSVEILMYSSRKTISNTLSMGIRLEENVELVA
ncbi:hypothetical protein CRU98_08515 [Arcobacter sp. CECT 8986]|uniref:hypothetical protein n=1 Tax=Arcobacter sp. CECT 8986 TaxID=2044507 RepID=UPI001009E47C|nr:hypothetical protein [Arcobacter sp. CECT 8986]RXJ98798.1 hypothetical protein CRU98_08515 [Arcobacter sp. CECT 8986]